METYLLKFSACLAVFWLVYVLFLERQTMHQFKRFYLLAALILSLAIPNFTITEYVEPVITNNDIAPAFLPTAFPEIIPIEEPSFFTLKNTLWFIYGFVALLLAIRFVINLIKMQQRISKNENIHQRSFIYVLLHENIIPHSYFKYIFFNKTRYESNNIPKEVMLHEETHAKQLHSLDIIILELLQIIFWFHPLIYILKHHVKLNHEFLADQAVLQQGSDAKVYQNILLQFSSNTQNQQLSSAINYSSIKKRFTVMKTQTSKTRIWLSTLILLPIMALLFYSFAEREYVEKSANEKSSFLVTVEKKGNLLELRCKNGCKWSHLILQPNSEPYIINDYGFSNGKTLETDKFTFSIKPSESGVDLNGIKGTTWIDLSFSLPENQKQAVNQLGMTSTIPNHEEGETEKIMTMKAINNTLFIGEKKSSINTYVKDLNEITKNWSQEDFERITFDLNTENCSKPFLDNLNELHKKTDYFLITVLGISPNDEITSNKTILEQDEPIMVILINRNGELLVDDEAGTLKTLETKLKVLVKSYDSSNGVLLRYDPTHASEKALKEVKSLIRKYDFNAIQEDASPQLPIMTVLINRKGQLLVDDKLGSLKSIETKLKTLTKSFDNSKAVFVKYDPTDASEKALKEVRTLIRAFNFKVIQVDASYDSIIPPAPPAPPKPIKSSDKGGPNLGNSDYQKSGPIKINGVTYYYIQNNGKTTHYDNYGRVADITKIPPPPPPPPVPINATAKQKAEMQKAQDAYNKAQNANGATNKDQVTGFTEINGEKLYYVSKDGETTYFNRYGKVVKMDNLPPPPPTLPSSPKNPSFLEYMEDMEKQGATFYLDNKKISAKKAKSIAKSNKGKSTEMMTKLDDNGKYIVKLSSPKENTQPIINGKVGKDIATKKESIFPIVNGKTIKSGKTSMTRDEFKNIKLETKNGKVTEFKLKIPFQPTQLIKSNNIDALAISNLKNTKADSELVIFAIKHGSDIKIEPLVITITD